MIIDCNYLALNNPDDFLPNPTYKSGLLDEEKGYVKYGYPSSSYPVLNMPYVLEDYDGNSVAPGFYEIVLSPNRKMLYFVESNNIRASIPVSSLVEKMVSDEEERNKLAEQEKLDKKYKKNPRKKPLNQAERKHQASMEASIDGNNPNYYVLHYRNGNIEAKGYILK